MAVDLQQLTPQVQDDILDAIQDLQRNVNPQDEHVPDEIRKDPLVQAHAKLSAAEELRSIALDRLMSEKYKNAPSLTDHASLDPKASDRIVLMSKPRVVHASKKDREYLERAQTDRINAADGLRAAIAPIAKKLNIIDETEIGRMANVLEVEARQAMEKREENMSTPLAPARDVKAR